MTSMITLLLLGSSVVTAALAAALVRRRRNRSPRRDARRLRRGYAADPYAEQRKPDKLNPGLGGFGSGGG
jgi:hypothetical protein